MKPAHLAYLKALAAGLASVSAADAVRMLPIALLPENVGKWLAIGLSACAFGAHVIDGFLKSLEPKP